MKTNEHLQFAVLTGCLRISKESIFTGLNNLQVFSLTDKRCTSSFGFTEQEVADMLAYYHLTEHAEVMKEWYDGYLFGDTPIYCPLDVINFCAVLRENLSAFPQNFWVNTSGNSMIRRLIDQSQKQTKEEIERLIAGETIVKPICQELTYHELDRSIDNLWSVLFTTGYLTQEKQIDETHFALKIPNKEIRELFISQIQVWFQETIRADVPRIATFCKAFPNGDANLIEEMLNDYLWNTISIRDTSVRKTMKENFYHGLLLGLLQYEDSWLIKSNAESGEGFSDILIETQSRTGIVIEFKYAEDDDLEKWCIEALDQIERNHYEARLVEDGMKSILKYGIAFYKKHCKVIHE